MKTCFLATPKAAAQVSNSNTNNTSNTTGTTSQSRTMARRMTPTGAIVESESSSSSSTTTTTTSPPPTRQERHPSSIPSSSLPAPVKQKQPPAATTTSPLLPLYNEDSLPDVIDDSENDLTEESENSFKSSLLSSTEFTDDSSLRLKGWYSVTNYPLVDNCGNVGIYTGRLARDTDKPHGFGHMEYDPKPNSPDAGGGVVKVVYEGQWLTGDWCGFGKLTDATCTYQGGFFDNMKHGLGVIRYHNNNGKYADGEDNGRTLTYDGAFSLNSMTGKGHMLYPDGSKFWGYWDDQGLPHGRGKQSFVDGRVYDGEFDCGALHGHGRMTWPDGRWYLGEWIDGQRTGLGIEVLPNGELYHEGTFCNGMPAEGSSFPSRPMSRGDFLLYRTSSMGHPTGRGTTLLGKLPRDVDMRKNIRWMLKW
jgi:hypothetical protein